MALRGTQEFGKKRTKIVDPAVRKELARISRKIWLKASTMAFVATFIAYLLFK